MFFFFFWFSNDNPILEILILCLIGLTRFHTSLIFSLFQPSSIPTWGWRGRERGLIRIMITGLPSQRKNEIIGFSLRKGKRLIPLAVKKTTILLILSWNESSSGNRIELNSISSVIWQFTTITWCHCTERKELLNTQDSRVSCTLT